MADHCERADSRVEAKKQGGNGGPFRQSRLASGGEKVTGKRADRKRTRGHAKSDRKESRHNEKLKLNTNFLRLYCLLCFMNYWGLIICIGLLFIKGSLQDVYFVYNKEGILEEEAVKHDYDNRMESICPEVNPCTINSLLEYLKDHEDPDIHIVLLSEIHFIASPLVGENITLSCFKKCLITGKALIMSTSSVLLSELAFEDLTIHASKVEVNSVTSGNLKIFSPEIKVCESLLHGTTQLETSSGQFFETKFSGKGASLEIVPVFSVNRTSRAYFEGCTVTQTEDFLSTSGTIELVFNNSVFYRNSAKSYLLYAPYASMVLSSCIFEYNTGGIIYAPRRINLEHPPNFHVCNSSFIGNSANYKINPDGTRMIHVANPYQTLFVNATIYDNSYPRSSVIYFWVTFSVDIVWKGVKFQKNNGNLIISEDSILKPKLTITLEKCSFYQNKQPVVISTNTETIVLIKNSVFRDHSNRSLVVLNEGNSGFLEIVDCEFLGNNVSVANTHTNTHVSSPAGVSPAGGAVSLLFSNVAIIRSTFESNFNHGNGNGGAMDLYSNTILFKSLTCKKNQVKDPNSDKQLEGQNGGCAMIDTQNITIVDSVITENNAAHSGGGVFFRYDVLRKFPNEHTLSQMTSQVYLNSAPMGSNFATGFYRAVLNRENISISPNHPFSINGYFLDAFNQSLTLMPPVEASINSIQYPDVKFAKDRFPMAAIENRTFIFQDLEIVGVPNANASVVIYTPNPCVVLQLNLHVLDCPIGTRLEKISCIPNPKQSFDPWIVNLLLFGLVLGCSFTIQVGCIIAIYSSIRVKEKIEIDDDFSKYVNIEP